MEGDVEIEVFLTSALVRCESSASRPGRSIPGERFRVTHFIAGWVGTSAGVDDMEK
jgi:hypothetical protein